MFSGDVVESLNAFLKDIFLTATSRGGGKGTPEEQLIELLFQAMSCGFLYKEMPRWRERRAWVLCKCNIVRTLLGSIWGKWLGGRCCIPVGPRGEERFVTAHTISVGLNPFESIQVLQVGHLNHVGCSSVIQTSCI